MILPKQSRGTKCKYFIRTPPDYRNIIIDQALNKSFHDSLEPIQYNDLLAVSGAIRGASKE